MSQKDEPQCIPAEMSSPTPLQIPPEVQLAGFLAKYSPEIAALADAVLVKMRRRLPQMTELVYDNYNALAIGFSPTERASDAIFSIAVFPRWVSLFFLKAAGLRDPGKMLKGGGKRVRHIKLQRTNDFDGAGVADLIDQALALAEPKLSPLPRRMIIKSVSATQRSRRPGEKPAPRVKKTDPKRESTNEEMSRTSRQRRAGD